MPFRNSSTLGKSTGTANVTISEIAQFANVEFGGEAMSFSSDDNQICGYYWANGQRPIVWDAATGEDKGIDFANVEFGGEAFSFSSDDNQICGYYFDANGFLIPIVWDAITGQKVRDIQYILPTPPYTLQSLQSSLYFLIFNDTHTLMSGAYLLSADGIFLMFPFIFNMKTNTVSDFMFFRDGPEGFASQYEITSAAGGALGFSSDDTRICGYYYLANGQNVRPIVWDATSGNNKGIVFENVEFGGKAFSFSSDDTQICGVYVDANGGRFPIVWNATTGEDKHIEFANVEFGGEAMSFSSDDTQICGYYFDANGFLIPIVWDAVTGNKIL